MSENQKYTILEEFYQKEINSELSFLNERQSLIFTIFDDKIFNLGDFKLTAVLKSTKF